LEEEIWKDIPGYEGYYQVSDMGRVKSLDRMMTIEHPIGGRRTVLRKGQILKNKVNNHGKNMVSLSKNNKIKESNVSRLVLLAFVGIPNEDQECCHRNDIQTDDRLNNLYWGTRDENIKDKERNNKQPKGIKVGTSKLKEGEVYLIKKLLNTKKYTCSFIAKMFKVDRTTISKIKQGINWKHITLTEEVLV
jgi:hypothetical protein